MSWKDSPRGGEDWLGLSPVGRKETRRVFDRALNGDVFYGLGTDRYRCMQRCTEQEWGAWAATARLVKSRVAG